MKILLGQEKMGSESIKSQNCSIVSPQLCKCKRLKPEMNDAELQN